MSTRKCRLVIEDEVWCYISGLHVEHTEFLYNKFGIFQDGYRYVPAFQMRRWDGKIRFFEKTGKTYVALLEEIIPFLTTWGYELTIDDKREYWEPPTRAQFDEALADFAEIGIIPRQYQVDQMWQLIESGNGFGILATGWGKSIGTALLSATFGKVGYRTITVVPSSDLVTQTAEWFRKCGLDVGEYGGGSKDMDRQHVIATWQSLQNVPHHMKSFQVFTIDEGHGVRGAVIQELINEYGSKIAFRFGLTGTLPQDKVSAMKLFCSIGTVRVECSASWLIANGYLAEVDIEILQTVEPVDEEFPDYPSERSFITKSKHRREFLADLICARAEQHGNTLVLVHSVPFGRELAAMIDGAVFLSGASEKDVRKLNYDLFDKRDDLIVIATAGIASTGISIDRVFCLMLVDVNRSFIQTIQSIGRGLRMAKDKNKVHVVDVSAYLKYSKKHLKERMKFYREAGYPHTAKPIKVKIAS